MGIFDFFRKLTKDEEKTTLERVDFLEIPSWVERRMIENSDKEKKILVILREKIYIFCTEVNEKIKLLKAFDVDSKKEADKLKSLTNQGRYQYIESLNNLLDKLQNIDDLSFGGCVLKINRAFEDFNRESSKTYEKATILIGKEMAAIRDSLKLFSKDIMSLYEDNKIIIKSYDLFDSIKSKFNFVSSYEDEIRKLGEKIKGLMLEVEAKENEVKSLLIGIEKIKQSKDYIERLNSLKKISELKEDIKRELSVLRQKVNFKALVSFYHISQDRLELVKKQRDNFYDLYELDEGREILSLLEESKLITNEVVETNDKIKILKRTLSKCESEIKEDKTQGFNLQVNEKEGAMHKIKEEIGKEEKRSESVKLSKIEILDSLKKELLESNVEIISSSV